MKHLRSLVMLVCVCAATGAQAELYKWVGPDGKTNYTDAPPPPAAKQVQTKTLDTSSINTAGLPYELAQATKNNPVTLYTGADCPPCDEGRAMLAARGIPFAEKTVSSNEDLAKLRQAGGDNNLPLLLVGRSKQKGFSNANWDTALTAAGYPAASKLPKNYRNPAATSAAPVAKPAAPQQAQAQQEDGQRNDVPPASGNAPPGFRF